MVTRSTTQRVLLQAVMQDGTIIRDEATRFEDFTALVLGFRRDPDVARLTWTVLVETPATEGTVAA
jgi:hypothetical protein